MEISFGFILMVLSLIGIVLFSVILLTVNRSRSRRKEEIYRSVQDEYARKS